MASESRARIQKDVTSNVAEDGTHPYQHSPGTTATFKEFSLPDACWVRHVLHTLRSRAPSQARVELLHFS